ncbi:MAG TPA: hypothetical protein VMV90_08590 [Rectinemataceae bacterium]|nr:hypothetical protein [Rectinemataceae bacterium]
MTGKALSPAFDTARTARSMSGLERAERSARILELKTKLGDEEYMAGAILRIATVLSARLTEGYFDGGRATR